PPKPAGSPITGSRVYRSTSPGTETLLTSIGNVTAWDDNNVSAGVTYYYRITALNSIGESARSNEGSATPTAAATVPGAPTLTFAAGASNPTHVHLAWSAPSNTGGSTITGYRVYRSTSPGTETLLTSIGNVTAWDDNNVSAGVTYYYQITALNSIGESARSNEGSATATAGTGSAPGAPILPGGSG